MSTIDWCEMSHATIFASRRCIAVICFCVIILVLLLVYHSNLTGLCLEGNLIIQQSSAKHNHSNNDVIASKNDVNGNWNKNSSNELLILQWTAFFGVKNWMAPEGTRVTSETRTANQSCVFTSDRQQLAKADYVMFHARDYAANDMPIARYSTNRWVFFSQESQIHTMTPMARREAFNFSMTFRHDADFTASYGQCRVLTTPRPPVSTSLLKAKSKLAAAMISNCRTQSQREIFIKELRRYIPIDVYGACGTPCPTGNRSADGHTDDCARYISTHYKFILAFENSLCEDYITEKIFRFIQDNLYAVPVVFGLANYSAHLPPSSFIDVASLDTLHHLAEYLVELDRNWTAYAQYYDWRTRYQCGGSASSLLDFCERAHALRHVRREHCVSCEAWKTAATCVGLLPRQFGTIRRLMNDYQLRNGASPISEKGHSHVIGLVVHLLACLMWPVQLQSLCLVASTVTHFVHSLV